MSDNIRLNKAVHRGARAVLKRRIIRKYDFTTDSIPDTGEPFILLANHTTEDDMFLVAIAARQHMYFVCGEHLLRNKLYGKPLRVLLDPIPLPKGGASLVAVKEILRRVKAGHNICMFPEGKRSFHGETIPSPDAIGKLVKKAGCALVTYRIRGGYFTYPRWARDHHRKGHVEGKVMGVYSSAELAGMSARQITDIINRDTYENAYEVQREKMWTYTGTDRAKGLEHILFMCPVCHGMDTIETEGDELRCSCCGLRAVYNDYGFFDGEGLPFDNVHSWMRWIEPEFDRLAAESGTDQPMFIEKDVLLYRMLEGYKNEDILTDTLMVYKDRLVIADREFTLNDIPQLSILFGNIVLFTYDGEYYGLTGEQLRAWKCARLWHLTKGDTDDKTKEI